jgi:hypothetical protein
MRNERDIKRLKREQAEMRKEIENNKRIGKWLIGLLVFGLLCLGFLIGLYVATW